MLISTVRVSAKELTALILDEERLRSERRDRKSWKSRVQGIDDHEQEPQTRPKRRDGRPRHNEDEDLEYRLALEASKNEAEEEAKRRAAKTSNDDDDDLAKAIKLSKEEEELRRRELEEANANSLFDDTPGQPAPAPAQPTGWNQGYQQQAPVDWFGNPIEQQPQNTGYPVQNTGYQNGFGFGQQGQPGFGNTMGNNMFMQPQQTAFNMSNNPYGQQQQNGFGAFGQQPQQQQESALQPGSNNPWSSNNSLQAEVQKPMPTGSNNPFASSFNRPQSAQAHRPPTLSTLSEQKAATSFNNPIMNFSNPAVTSPTQQTQQSFLQQQPTQQQPLDPHHARLNALLASGEGQDTFGNVGDLRIPAQHTAPGTFVNSAGSGLNRITGQPTGNPFLNSQFTGMPQQNRMQPAQTGPAFGGGGNNPFGRSQTQGGNLIDL